METRKGRKKSTHTVIEDVDCKLLHVECIEECLDRDGEAVEHALAVAPRWHLCEAERRQVGHQDAEFRCEWDRLAELEGRSWEAVEQKQDRCSRWASGTIKDVYAVGLDVFNWTWVKLIACIVVDNSNMWYTW